MKAVIGGLLFFCSITTGCNKGGYTKGLNGLIDNDGWTIAHTNFCNNFTGPYRFLEAISCEEIRVKVGSNNFTRIKLRGMRATGDAKIDMECKNSLNRWLRTSDVYLLSDTIVQGSSNTTIAFAVKETVQHGDVDVSTGNIEMRTERYALISHGQIHFGLAFADRTDKNCWAYSSLLAAEDQAKEKKKGYWRTH